MVLWLLVLLYTSVSSPCLDTALGGKELVVILSQAWHGKLHSPCNDAIAHVPHAPGSSTPLNEEGAEG